MKDCWTRNWKKALVWACGYLSIIAFAVVGGYAIFKSEDAELKQATKKCFIVVLIFAAINAFQSLMNSILGMSSYCLSFSGVKIRCWQTNGKLSGKKSRPFLCRGKRAACCL